MIARPDIDAVMISTPDHWHVPMAMAAVKAGKDVALEKPITRYIDEGRLLADLVTRHKRIFRVDSEFRSLAPFHRAAELVRNGRIGKLHTIRTGSPARSLPGRAGDRDAAAGRTRLRTVARPGARGALHTKARPHAAGPQEPARLDAQPGLLRRHDHQLGHPPQRYRPVGQRHRAHRPGRNQGHRHLPHWQSLERAARPSTPGTAMPTASSCSTRWASRMCGSRARKAGSRSITSQDKLNPESLLASDPAILKEKIGPKEIHFPLRSEKTDFIECVKSRAADSGGCRGRPPHHLAVPYRPYRDPAGRRKAALGPETGTVRQRSRQQAAQPPVLARPLETGMNYAYPVACQISGKPQPPPMPEPCTSHAQAMPKPNRFSIKLVHGWYMARAWLVPVYAPADSGSSPAPHLPPLSLPRPSRGLAILIQCTALVAPEFLVFDNGLGRGSWTLDQQARTATALGSDGISYNCTTPWTRCRLIP